MRVDFNTTNGQTNNKIINFYNATKILIVWYMKYNSINSPEHFVGNDFLMTRHWTYDSVHRCIARFIFYNEITWFIVS